VDEYRRVNGPNATILQRPTLEASTMSGILDRDIEIVLVPDDHHPDAFAVIHAMPTALRRTP
jgi:hypothetical protein